MRVRELSRFERFEALRLDTSQFARTTDEEKRGKDALPLASILRYPIRFRCFRSASEGRKSMNKR
jgi:hypothetical protein